MSCDKCPAYLAWLRRQPCAACGIEPAGSVHHTGRSGMGQRPHDSMAVPLCQVCHVEELHAAKGWARGLEKRHVKAWEAMALDATQARAFAAGWRFYVGQKPIRYTRHQNGELQTVADYLGDEF